MRSIATRVLLLASLLCSPATAQNLVYNATFGVGLAGWSYPPTSAQWMAQDANGSPASG